MSEGKLAGRVALVTGAGQGVGQGIAYALAAEGARVAVAGRTTSKLDRTVDEIQRRGGEAIAVRCDVKKLDSLERPGMTDPKPRLEDMDLEGIDQTVMFPGGAGEEWAGLDRDFAVALCRTLNDARAEYTRYSPERLKSVAKLPMIDPEAAAAELRRAVRELGMVGMVTTQHVREKNLDHPSFDVVWTYHNGIVAALVGYEEMGSADLDEAANIVMADDAKICKGDFASGRKISEPADLVSVKRLFTSCRSEGKSVEIHYTLVKTKSGHLIQLAHLNLGGATGNVATADSAFLQASVLSTFK